MRTYLDGEGNENNRRVKRKHNKQFFAKKKHGARLPPPTQAHETCGAHTDTDTGEHTPGVFEGVLLAIAVAALEPAEETPHSCIRKGV